MSIRLRIFLLEEDGEIVRVPVRAYDQMFRRDSRRSLSPLANKIVRCAEVVVEVENRRPMRVVHTSCPILVFDRHGRLSEKSLGAGMRLAVDSLCWEVLGGESENQEERQGRVSQCRTQLREEFCWQPTESERAMIEQLALRQSVRPSRWRRATDGI